MVTLIRACTILIALLLTACEGRAPIYQEQAYVFGTLVEVSVHGEPEPRARQAVAVVMREFQRLHDSLHAWQPSELSELNAAFARGESAAISSELVMILNDVIQFAEQSDGAFNPAIGGVVQLWGFHADEFGTVQPDEKLIAKWLAGKPQMKDIRIERGRAESSNKSVQLDLGGYAKGYALDRAIVLLREQGVKNALINIGGNVIALGTHGNRPWRVGIQHPRKPGALAMLELHDGEAIGTSGDYQRYFEVGGIRYCHLINPRSGYPMQGVQAVTVVTHGPRAGILSDVASKPLFIAGTSGWREAARKLGVAEAMLVDAHGNVRLTAELQQRLEFTDKFLRPQVE